jgi:hypothetical protein
VKKMVLAVLAMVVGLGWFSAQGLAQSSEVIALETHVIKACSTCALPAAPACDSVKRHWDKAGSWLPNRAVFIHGVSIAENTEITLYVDIEVSTAPFMYLDFGHIFRMKYAGPGILRNPPCPVSYVGSNITSTQKVLPAGTGIYIPSGVPVYIHSIGNCIFCD